MDLPNEPPQLLEDPKNKAFIYNVKEDMKIQLNPQGTNSKYRPARITKQDSKGDKGSGSLYFTPSSTPLRELSASPTKGRNSHYSAVYQTDGGGSCSTLPKNSRTGRNLSIKKMKPPLLKTHRKSRSFSFPFMPSYWFGNTNDEIVTNVQGDNDCDNSNQRVHKVMVEREACGSRDYLDVDTSINANQTEADDEGLSEQIYCGKNNNDDVEFDECDALLPDSKKNGLEGNHFISIQNADQKEQLENTPRRIQESITSFSTPNSSSSSASSSNHSNNESSVTGITTTETATSNSELYSTSTTGQTNTTSASDDISLKRKSRSLECEELLIVEDEKNKDDSNLHNQVKSNNSSNDDTGENRLNQKRKSMY